MGALLGICHRKPDSGLLHQRGRLSTQGQELQPLATCSRP